MTINLLPKKTWKRSLWKTINIVSSIALVFNMSMIGVFIAPKAAAACSGSISGYKWNDLNGNGVWDNGEPGLNGWTMTLYKQDGSNWVNKTNTLTKNDQSNNPGYYKFDIGQYGYGQYKVVETQQQFWINTYPGVDQPSDQIFHTVNFRSNANFTDKNFGNFDKGRITGKKFNDLNGNSVWDNGELALQDWTIKATKGADVKTTTTDENGQYVFGFLPNEVGTWIISEIQQDGWLQTFPADKTYSINIQSGTSVTHKDFGNHQDMCNKDIDDHNACTTDACDPATGEVTHTPVNADDGNACTIDQCNPDTGNITHTAKVVDDQNVCTADSCNPATGEISHNAIGVDDGNACTIDSCDPINGVSHDSVNVDDHNACTIDSCNEDTGEVTHNAKNIDDENACTNDECNEDTGDVTHTAINVDDQNVCTTDQCNEKTGEITHDPINYNDGNACTIDSCDPVDGVKHDPKDTNDNNACTIDECNEETGDISHEPINVNDDDRCTDDACNQETGEITHNYNEEICPLTGSIKVNKKVDTDADGTFEGGNDEANTLGFLWGIDGATANLSMGSTASDQTQGSHDINENSVAGYHFVGWYYDYEEIMSYSTSHEDYNCNNPQFTTLPANINVKKGDLTEITLCNARDTGTLIVHKNVVAADGLTDIIDNHNFTINLNGADPQNINEATTVAYNNLLTGSYNVSEVVDPNYILVSITDNGTVSVTKDTTTDVFIVNKVKSTTGTLTKTAPAQVNAGDNITYTINWAISGSAPATNLTLTDPIPANTTFVSAANGGVYDSTNKIVTWSLGTKNPGDAGTVTFIVQTAAPLANNTIITNTAYLKAAEIDPALQASAQTKVVSAPVLTITKVVDKTPVNPGNVVTYTVKIKNTGTDTAVNVQLTDLLPTGFTFTDFGGSTHTFSLGNLAVGAEVTVTYKATVGASVVAGSYENLAVASAENNGNVTAKVAVEVVVPKVLGEEALPVLTIKKTADKPFINPGNTVTFTVVVTNKGDAPAIDVQLQDILPAGFTFTDKTITKTFSLGDLAPGASKQVTYQAISDTTIKPGKYENLAVASAKNHDKISTSVSVEVRQVIVKGAELPTTGAFSMNMLYILAAGLIIGFVLVVLKLTSSKEENL